MTREELLKTLNDIDKGLSMREDRESLADFILANFTPKEAEKVTAKECYLSILAGYWANAVNVGVSTYTELTEIAYSAAKAFNEYKQDNEQ